MESFKPAENKAADTSLWIFFKNQDSGESKMSEKKFEWLPLTKWKDHFSYPSQGSMRNICARRKDNGAESFLSLVHGRFYVHIEKFNEWMEKQSHLRR